MVPARGPLGQEIRAPVLILHAVRFGEKCSFPYLGNSPTLRYDPATGPDLKVVLGQILVEVLRNIHFRQHFEDLRRLFGLPVDVRALPQAPELLTLLELRDDPRNRGVTTVVHQDPPLGEHLLGVLRRFAPELLITTPTMVLTAGGALSAAGRPLFDKVIGLSISDSPGLDSLGFDKIHLDDAAVEFARYLLESRAILAYGGDLRPGGFTALLRNLVWTYNATDGGIPSASAVTSPGLSTRTACETIRITSNGWTRRIASSSCSYPARPTWQHCRPARPRTGVPRTSGSGPAACPRCASR